MARKNNVIEGQMSIFDFLAPPEPPKVEYETPEADKLRADGWKNMYDETPPVGFYEVCDINKPNRIWVTECNEDGSWWNPDGLRMSWWRPLTYKSDEVIYREAILHGSGFAGGKKRIIDFFASEYDDKKRIEFLKNEYGVGGWTTDYGCVDHNAGGLDFSYKEEYKQANKYAKLVHSGWPMVAKEIEYLIQRGIYTADVEPVTKHSCNITGLECKAHSNKGCATPGKCELLKEVVKENNICKHSEHTCNKEELWKVAVEIGVSCPKSCCRVCDIEDCGARCNGAPLTKEPPILLQEGQIVYKVLRCDIIPYKVSGSTWTYNEGKQRNYDLLTLDEHPSHSICSNTSINNGTFLTLEDAESWQAKMIEVEGDDLLQAKNMKIKEVVAYSYIFSDFYKNGTDREIINFYAVLDNGLIYVHSGSKYEHCYKDIKKGVKEYEEDKERLLEYNKDITELSNYMPALQNMYKTNHDTWDWAEARYNRGLA